MKKLLFILLFATGLVKAQSTDHPFLKLLTKENSPISKEFIAIENFESVDLAVLKLTDLTTDKVYGGVRFGFKLLGRDYINLVDKQELDLFLKIMTKVSADSVITQHQYLEITSSSGVQFKITNANELHLWSYQVVIDKARPDANFNFGKKGLFMLIERLNKAKEIIKDWN